MTEVGSPVVGSEGGGFAVCGPHVLVAGEGADGDVREIDASTGSTTVFGTLHAANDDNGVIATMTCRPDGALSAVLHRPPVTSTIAPAT